MNKTEIKPDIYWVGGIDWDIRNFHGYLTQRGTTYNAYLIMDEKIKLPKETPVPMPKIDIDEEMPVSKLLTMAMTAEEKAGDFYKSLAERFEEGCKIHNTLLYFSDMEKGHYKILEIEKESTERFEESDVYWPMVHVGP